MSTALVVPETWELCGDDARRTLSYVGWKRLLRDAFVRLRFADGFSHARAIAFMTTLLAVQALVVVVGFASVSGHNSLSDAITRAIRAAAPGPAGETLTTAVQQAEGTGLAHRLLPLVLGLVGSLVTGASVFGQIERGFNRLYGIEQDRPSVRKYGRGLLLAVTAGTCSACAFGLVALGDSIEETSQTGWIRRGAGVAGWPLAIVAVTAAVTMLMRWCPRRHQPGPSWLAYGSAVSVLGWLIVTFGLRAVFHLTSTFGDTYGPLAGMVALLVWSLLSAIALLYGVAVTAQLEAARAGRPGPTDAVKVARSEAGELTSAQS